MICYHCTAWRQSGDRCETCGDTSVFCSPVEFVRDLRINVSGMPSNELDKIRARINDTTVVVRRFENYVVLQTGTERITIWNPGLLVTVFEPLEKR